MTEERPVASDTTTPEFWDNRWGVISSAVVNRGGGQVSDAILNFFDKYTADFHGGSILEIGGAPGRYLGRLVIDHDLSAFAIDYSPIGCDQLRKNFEQLGKDVTVIERDVFKVDAQQHEKFDVVFSLGLIEHFENVDEIVERHVQYLKPDGVLVLGVPNCRGIYHWFWKSLSPDLLSKHVLPTMKKKTWQNWEKKCGLKRLEVSYVGGFHPGSLDKRELKGWHWKKPLALVLRVLFNRRFNILKHSNSPFLASYLIGAFQIEPDTNTE